MTENTEEQPPKSKIQKLTDKAGATVSRMLDTAHRNTARTSLGAAVTAAAHLRELARLKKIINKIPDDPNQPGEGDINK